MKYNLVVSSIDYQDAEVDGGDLDALVATLVQYWPRSVISIQPVV